MPEACPYSKCVVAFGIRVYSCDSCARKRNAGVRRTTLLLRRQSLPIVRMMNPLQGFRLCPIVLGSGRCPDLAGCNAFGVSAGRESRATGPWFLMLRHWQVGTRLRRVLSERYRNVLACKSPTGAYESTGRTCFCTHGVRLPTTIIPLSSKPLPMTPTATTRSPFIWTAPKAPEIIRGK